MRNRKLEIRQQRLFPPRVHGAYPFVVDDVVLVVFVNASNYGSLVVRLRLLLLFRLRSLIRMALVWLRVLDGDRRDYKGWTPTWL